MAAEGEPIPQEQAEPAAAPPASESGAGTSPDPAAQAPSATAPEETAAAAEAAPAQIASPPPVEGSISEKDIDYLLKQAEEALASVDTPVPSGVEKLAPYSLEEFSGAPVSSDAATLELIRDVELELRIELGRTQMYVEDVLKLRKGSVVALEKLAGDPVDVYVNGRLIARGEVLVLNDNFCVRVNELLAGQSAGTPQPAA
ncbi:MAG: flagellar motor switch protein FliN [Planctomycetia bacterium]|nr:flagellar motor switch protein FliN [Planctomycetia bacterium]